jgi:hypothetical protein
MLKKLDPYKPKSGYIYAVSSGSYLGSFFIFMETLKNKSINFLAVPKMKIQTLLPDNFTSGLSGNILEFQEKLPNNVYKTCLKQYTRLKNEVNN